MSLLRKLSIGIFLGCVIPGFVIAQTSEENKKLAQDYIDQANEILSATPALDLVRDLYILAADADPDNIEANFKAGDVLMKTIGKDRAAKYFQRVFEIDADYRFDVLYWLGFSYQYGLEFDLALEAYNRYRDHLVSNDGYRGNDRVMLSTVDRRIYECRNGKELVANPAHYSIVNVGSAINTESRDYAPVLNRAEDEMVFTSRRRDGNLNANVANDNLPYEDIYISKKVNGVWQYAQNIGEIVNTEFHDSNLALSADGDQLFLYSDENNGDIFTSKKLGDGSWTVPEPIGDNINSSYSENSVSLSPDGNMLFFSSNRPSHVGDDENMDIYYSVMDENGNWGRPKTVGEVINSEYNEDAPFLDYDGKTLYFSSDGRRGMGGYDIFRSVYDSTEGVWGAPANIGYPINTPDNDVFFVSTEDGQRGYYASVREDGMGYTDIYMVTILQDGQDLAQVDKKDIEPKEVEKPDTNVDIDPVEPTEPELTLQPVILTVNVEDAANELPIDAKVSMKSVGTNVIVASKRASVGSYTFEVRNTASTEYLLTVEKSGYVFNNSKLNIQAVAGLEPKRIQRSISLQKFQVGVSRVLHNIYFNFDKATFATESYSELNKLEKMLAGNPNTKVEISGHTDNIGAKEYNKKLSQMRANAVVNYLAGKGIDKRRLTAVGYGEEHPLASNDDNKEGREINRRVEFRILGK